MTATHISTTENLNGKGLHSHIVAVSTAADIRKVITDINRHNAVAEALELAEARIKADLRTLMNLQDADATEFAKACREDKLLQLIEKVRKMRL